ncbi:Acyl-coenzyme A:6-aminopenicillanic acid acyl-transferase [Symmachiella dynata]|uniref:C45 family autoproteolytic acyltransferase/hydolase n=1 Tax=Symmachiella dynata TaxID=2527995 RepID=UPI001187D97C|nr:C45 family peptidase [Symmachiella dynata]QDT48867.1 Acyl-coenzyme A:6-aminopenicillanic acid acyl-transferase [Symmachiella dynata]
MNSRLFAVALVTIISLALTATAHADGKLTSVGSGKDKIPVLVVKGTPYEMGRQQGELIKPQATEFISHILKSIQAADSERFTDRALDEAWAASAEHTDPRFQEELKGLAAGSGLSLKLLQRAHAIPMIADYSCSSISAWGKATKDGHLYQTRNLDWEMGLRAQEFPLIVVYIPDEGIPHVNITFAGCIGSNTGMNAAGIVLSEMGDSPSSDYPFDFNGVHFTTLFRNVLYDANGLDEAVDIFKNAKRTKKYHYVVGDGKNGRAVKMLAHAPNLVIWEDNDATDEMAPRIFKDIVYQDEGRGAFQPLKKAYGNIGSQEMIDLACKIPIKGANVLDVVYDATALEFWVAYAEKDEDAYKRPFVHVKLKDYLD